MFNGGRPLFRCRGSFLFNLLRLLEIISKLSPTTSSSSSAATNASRRTDDGWRRISELEIVVVVKSRAADATRWRVILERLLSALLPNGADGVDGRVDLVPDRVLLVWIPRIQRGYPAGSATAIGAATATRWARNAAW